MPHKGPLKEVDESRDEHERPLDKCYELNQENKGNLASLIF